jgi:hypothetical protein
VGETCSTHWNNDEFLKTLLVEYLKGRSDHFGGLLKSKFVLQEEKVKVWNGLSWLKSIFSDGSMKHSIPSVAQ